MMTLQFFSAICFLLALSPLISSQATETYRLPLEVIPTSYSIQLIPYFDEGDSSRRFTFDGNVSIQVQAQRAENKITFHARNIEIHGQPVVTEVDGGNSITLTNVSRDLDRDFVILELGEALKVENSYRISISYTGSLTNDLYGFYRSSYTVNDTTRWLGATQFEPTYARLAFPCFDEPAIKATFDISIARLPELNAISNMPLKETTGPDPTLNGRYWDTFETTPKMSSYLIAFIVSDFPALQNGTYHIWAKPSRVQEGQFALEFSPKVINTMGNLTGIPYQLPKMDEVEVPDFAEGAMENWGLVTYRQGMLLLPSNASDYEAPSVAFVIAHELAHQWFGDLVTLNWWKFAWLNEGFASFFQFYATDLISPQWDMITRQVYSMFDTMIMDIGDQTHPLTMDVETPDEIINIFDTYSYNKGGSILRMIQHALTSETFFKGLNRYLTARSYSDATADDLSAGLQKGVDEDNALEEGLTVKAIMDSWTLQSSYPVVTVTRNYSAGTATLQQWVTTPRLLLSFAAGPSSTPSPCQDFIPVWWQRLSAMAWDFFASLSGSTALSCVLCVCLFEPKAQIRTDNASSSNQWYIPISYTTSEELEFNTTKPNLWLHPNSSAVLKNLPGKDQWIILNKQATGYFRINYDQANWNLLLEAVNGANYSQIHEYNRIQVMLDSQFHYRIGQLDVNTAMGIVSYLEREIEPAPWLVGLEGLENLYEKMGGSPYFPALQKFYRRLVGRFYDRIGLKHQSQESPLMSKLRPKIMHWACLFEHEECLESAARTVRRARIETDNRIDKMLQASVYCAAVRKNGESSWNWVWDIYQTTEDVKERQHALKALGCTSDSKLLKRLLGLTIHENSGLKPQDRINVFSAVCNGRDADACDIALTFVAKRINNLADLFGEYESVATILHWLGSKLKTPQQVNQLSSIIMKNRENLPEAISSNALHMARENIKWLNQKGAELAQWLSSQETVQEA